MAAKTQPLKRLFSAAFSQVRSYSAPAEKSIPHAKQKYVPTSGTYPKGFLAGSAHAGVKPSNTKYNDIALVVSEQPCPASAVFTRNIFKAAPTSLSHNILQHNGDRCRGVIVNSGCANAVTGTEGRRHAVEMSVATDQCYDPSYQPNRSGDWTHEDRPKTLVMSTGVIGQKLPIQRIKDAIPKAHASLGASHEDWMGAARAICTTDTFPKLLSRTFNLPSHPETEYRIAGMTKGAGMIHPNMGTLLAIICTDVKVAGTSDINAVLRRANAVSFNSISIDGDTSTNDTVAFFANGAAAPEDAQPLRYRNTRTESKQGKVDSNAAFPGTKDEEAFRQVLRSFMTDLAKLVVRDGEGATKFVTIRVRSLDSLLTARRVASSIATSALVKTALYGRDANWGRILCAIGYAPHVIANPRLGVHQETPNAVNPQQTSVSFIPTDGSEELKLLVRGEPQDVDEARAKEILEHEDLEILVRLNDRAGREQVAGGEGQEGDEVKAVVEGGNERRMNEAVYWTCDFSHEYVTINGDYRT